MLKNEEGFILPLMLGIFLIVAALLLMLSSRLEVKVASYSRTQDYLRMNILEQEGLRVLERMLATMEISEAMEAVAGHFFLSRGARIEINISFLQNSLEIDYQIVYNGFIRQRRLQYRFDHGVTFLE